MKYFSYQRQIQYGQLLYVFYKIKVILIVFDYCILHLF